MVKPADQIAVIVAVILTQVIQAGQFVFRYLNKQICLGVAFRYIKQMQEAEFQGDDEFADFSRRRAHIGGQQDV